MQPFHFSTFLTSNLQVREKELKELLRNCQIREVKEQKFLLREGEHCQTTFFVEKGLLKKYGINEKGKESILQFAPERWFVTDRDSYYFQQPSQFFIQALEDSRVFLLEENFLKKLNENLTGFTTFNSRLLHNHIRVQTKRIYELLSATAEERYLSFIHTYPDLIMRVPQWMIASYLGMTPESLSRVRKDLARKNN